MKPLKILILFFLIHTHSFYSQNTTRESWSFSAGISNFIMNGDLKANDAIINLGAYAYVDKMVSQSIGFELKVGYSKISGTGNDSDYQVNNTSLDKTQFKGNTVYGETNIIYNISNIFNNIHKTEKRKFNFSALTGLGLQQYNSKLYNSTTNELLADFGNSPSKNETTSSLYYTLGLNVKYKIRHNLELELRQNINVNNEDHLDAAISNKSSLDYFFKTNIGVVYNLNKKGNKSFAWYDKPEMNTKIEEKKSSNKYDLTDFDNDGVIDLYDTDNNTPKGAIVYGDGTAIDSDNDGIIDLHDKCPLEYAKTLTGCKKDLDSDKDGVIDSKDECPTIYAKTLDGCPKKKIIAKIEKPKTIIVTLTPQEAKKQAIIKEVNKNNTKHGNKELDNAVNINDVDTSPIYPGCENNQTKFNITNCIITSISSYINSNYNQDSSKKIQGKVRVLFIVKESGKIKVIDILGKYSDTSKNELKRVLETLPKVVPGTLKGIKVPVKYSLLFLLD